MARAAGTRTRRRPFCRPPPFPQRKRGPAFPPAPRVAGLSASRWPQGAARAFMSAACSARAGKGSGLRVLVNARRTPPVGHLRTASRRRIPACGKPRGGLPVRRQAALGPVTGAGAIPKDQLPTSMSFALPLPCGIGFAISVIQSCRPRRIASSRWPRPVHYARGRAVPCVWLSSLACAETPARLSNPLHPCPKAPVSRLVAWLVHAPGEHFPP